jgi:hypothetical protein
MSNQVPATISIAVVKNGVIGCLSPLPASGLGTFYFQMSVMLTMYKARRVVHSS